MTDHPKKALGIWRLTALIIGNMVGSGVFLLPSALAHFGAISIFAWIITGFGAMAVALVFASLAARLPKIGGPYAYCRDAFGDFIGFQVAWNYWIYVWVGDAAIAISFVGYLGFFFPPLSHQPLLSFLTATAVVWLLTLINIRGVKEAGIVQLTSVVLKIIPLIIIATLGLLFLHPNYFTLPPPHDHLRHPLLLALISSVTLTLWALTGVESATVPAEDVVEPQKNIPRATLIGTVISVLLYLFGTIAVMGVIPAAKLAHSSAPFAAAANAMVGLPGAVIIALAAIVSSFGALNGWTLLQGQIPLAAAKDKLFPRCFAKVSKRGTPVYGLVISSLLITLLLAANYRAGLVSTFTFAILLATMAILLVYFLTAMAKLMLLIKAPEKLPARVWLKQITICTIASVYALLAIIGAGDKIVFYGMLLFLIGVPVYVLTHWHQNRVTERV
ncbi:MAG: amino acid permease [Gammaproteobacteria bacterium]|nr:amino acid permease [Gammaproteobacteria bacterium]